MFKALKSDSELWMEVRNDNELAFNALFKRYWARLYKIAHHKLNDEESSLEIVHDVFLSLWTRRKELEIELFPNYLLISIRYQIYTRLKAPKLSIIYKADFEEKDNLSELNLGEAYIHDHDLQSELNLYLNKLPKRCHEIFNLSRIEHLSNQEIAQRLGISKRSVENQLTAALKHLRTAFKNIASLTILLNLLFKL